MPDIRRASVSTNESHNSSNDSQVSDRSDSSSSIEFILDNDHAAPLTSSNLLQIDTARGYNGPRGNSPVSLYSCNSPSSPTTTLAGLHRDQREPPNVRRHNLSVGTVPDHSGPSSTPVVVRHSVISRAMFGGGPPSRFLPTLVVRGGAFRPSVNSGARGGGGGGSSTAGLSSSTSPFSKPQRIGFLQLNSLEEY